MVWAAASAASPPSIEPKPAPLRRAETDRGVSQRKGQELIARLAETLAAPAGDSHELAAIHFVRARIGVAGGRQGELPQDLAGLRVEGAEFLIIGRCEKHQPARGGDRSADRIRARLGNTASLQLRELAVDYPPGE